MTIRHRLCDASFQPAATKGKVGLAFCRGETMSRFAALLCLVCLLLANTKAYSQALASPTYHRAESDVSHRTPSSMPAESEPNQGATAPTYPATESDVNQPPAQSIVTESITSQRRAQEFARGQSKVPYLALRPTSVAPVIDGVLDDVCWQNAPVISDFTQVDPVQGAAPTERTEVRVLYDQDHIYFAVRCYDREPHRIVATKMQHDTDLESDDTIALTFDTFGRKRSGYFFRMNAANARQEALVGAGGELKIEWDTIWYGRSGRDDQGWTAEISIPFKSISFDPKQTVWGFNVERQIRRKQEIDRWSSPFRNKSVSSLADFGQLQNLSGIRQGFGLEVKPFLAGRYRDQRDGGDRGFDFKPGVNAFYSITPSMTAALTVNTDFAEAEVDARQVNLTRFPLFFPEKRDFFLQDANLFGFNDTNGPLPFYSRRIGLGPNGEVIDILAGGKLTGRVGDLDVGLLDVQVDSSKHVDSENLSVARLAYRVLDESSIGGIFTYGNPRGGPDNWLAGVDLNYRNSHVFGNEVLGAQAWLLKSEETGVDGEQLAFGGALSYPNDPFWFELYANQIDNDFHPELGFVSRNGVRLFGGGVGYRWRPGGSIRSIEVDFSPQIYTDLSSTIETEYWTAPSVQITDQRGDQLSAGFISERENLFSGFEIQPGVLIPTGDYRFNRGYISLSSTSARPLNAYFNFDAGGFYNGSSQKYVGCFEWRASSHLYFFAQSELDDVDLPAGQFNVVISSARMDVSFNPSVSWNTLIQHDNISDNVGLYSRLKWTVRPGSDVYLVFKKGFDVEDGRFRSQTTEVSMKLGWTFRF